MKVTELYRIPWVLMLAFVILGLWCQEKKIKGIKESLIALLKCWLYMNHESLWMLCWNPQFSAKQHPFSSCSFPLLYEVVSLDSVDLPVWKTSKKSSYANVCFDFTEEEIHFPCINLKLCDSELQRSVRSVKKPLPNYSEDEIFDSCL